MGRFHCCAESMSAFRQNDHIKRNSLPTCLSLVGVQTAQIAKTGFQDAKFRAAQLPFCARFLTLAGDSLNHSVIETEDRFGHEKVWQFLDQAFFDGENANIINDLLQGDLFSVSRRQSHLRCKKYGVRTL